MNAQEEPVVVAPNQVAVVVTYERFFGIDWATLSHCFAIYAAGHTVPALEQSITRSQELHLFDQGQHWLTISYPGLRRDYTVVNTCGRPELWREFPVHNGRIAGWWRRLTGRSTDPPPPVRRNLTKYFAARL